MQNNFYFSVFTVECLMNKRLENVKHKLLFEIIKLSFPFISTESLKLSEELEKCITESLSICLTALKQFKFK